LIAVFFLLSIFFILTCSQLYILFYPFDSSCLSFAFRSSSKVSMYVKQFLFALALSASVFDGVLAAKGKTGANNANANGNANAQGNAAATASASTATASSANAGNNAASSSDLQLNPSVVQQGSQNDGLNETGAEAGEAASATYVVLQFCQDFGGITF
jgi:hypothetical protein